MSFATHLYSIQVYLFYFILFFHNSGKMHFSVSLRTESSEGNYVSEPSKFLIGFTIRWDQIKQVKETYKIRESMIKIFLRILCLRRVHPAL